jgi:membrane protein required for colicin V production
MNALDIWLVVVLAYFLIRGIFRGLVKEAVSFLGVFVAFWVAAVYWPNGAEQLKGVVNEAAYQSVLSFVIIFLVTYFLVGLLSIFVDKIVKLVITPFVSSIFGGLIGLVKGVGLAVVVLACSTVFIGQDEPFYRDSVAWGYFDPMTAELKSFLPDDLGRHMGKRRGVISGVLGAEAPPVAAPGARVGALAPPTDYRGIMAIVEKYPDQIKPIWKERLASMGPGILESAPAFLPGFIHDHPNLFPTPPRWGPPEIPKD